jgi:hypothetical protein
VRLPVVRVGGSLTRILMGGPPKPKEADAPHVREERTQSQRRQELMRQLSREVPQETERDAEIERDRGRQRDRG